MRSPGQIVITWIGRLFLLAVPIVLACGFFYPEPIQFLDRVACDEGLTLARDANNPDAPFDNRPICESDSVLIDATDRILAIATASLILAIGAYTFRSHITPRSLSAPRVPQHV